MRVAAIGDVHAREVEDVARVSGILAEAARDADVLTLTGDLTDHGRTSEAETLIRAAHTLDIPVLAVLGNHDHESGCAPQILRMLESGGVRCLDRASVTVDGVGFAGVKGFAGGFGRESVRAFGEDALKAFVSESVVEAEALRSALKGLDTRAKVALTHYAPVRETIEGEPREIHTFLGTSRLASAIDEGGATVAFHGHAHHGSLQGFTPGGVPVWNVSLPVLRAAGMTHVVVEV